MRQYLCKLVVSIEALPVMLVQNYQLPQRVQADDPCIQVMRLQSRAVCPGCNIYIAYAGLQYITSHADHCPSYASSHETVTGAKHHDLGPSL